MEVTIGKLVQFERAVFAMNRDETAWLKFAVGEVLGLRLNIRVTYQSDRMARIFAEEDYGVLEVPLIDEIGGQASSSPVYMGRHGGIDTFLTYQCYPYGSINQFAIQLYTKNE